MVVMKWVMPQTAPLFVAVVRLLPAGLLVLLAGRVGKRPLPQGWRAWAWIGLFALVDGALFQGFLTEGLVRTDAGIGSLLIDSQPLAVAVMAALFYGERLSQRGMVGLGLGVIGISLIGFPTDWQNLKQWGWFTPGEWLMLGASLSMAVGTILIRPVTTYADPVMATGWHMVLGSIPLLGLSLWYEHPNLAEIDLSGWLGLAYVSILGSAIAYGVFFYFASSGNLTTLSALTFSTPVFAIICGRIFLGEKLTPMQWVGVLLTLVSIYLVSRKD
jgi:drug/metabolite transporter (DMT)-like permease